MLIQDLVLRKYQLIDQLMTTFVNTVKRQYDTIKSKRVEHHQRQLQYSKGGVGATAGVQSAESKEAVKAFFAARGTAEAKTKSQEEKKGDSMEVDTIAPFAVVSVAAESAGVDVYPSKALSQCYKLYARLSQARLRNKQEMVDYLVNVSSQLTYVARLGSTNDRSDIKFG